MSKEIETWYAEVLKSRYITSAIRNYLQEIDRLYSTLARLKFEIYNLRKEADVEYTPVCGVVTCEDEKTRLFLEEKEKCIGLELAAIKRNVDDIVENRTKLITSEMSQCRNERTRLFYQNKGEKTCKRRPSNCG